MFIGKTKVSDNHVPVKHPGSGALKLLAVAPAVLE